MTLFSAIAESEHYRCFGCKHIHGMGFEMQYASDSDDTRKDDFAKKIIAQSWEIRPDDNGYYRLFCPAC